MRLPRPPPPPLPSQGGLIFIRCSQIWAPHGKYGPHGRPVMLVAPSSLTGIIIHNRATQKLVLSSLALNSQVQSLWFVYFYSKLLFFYKQVNVTSSHVPDHCIKYALNDPTDSSFRGSCDHTHDLLCQRCEELKSVLSDIQAAILNSPFESENERDDALHVFKEA